MECIQGLAKAIKPRPSNSYTIPSDLYVGHEFHVALKDWISAPSSSA